MKKLKWSVEFEVSENWVADGFEMTNDLAYEMLNNVLGWAYENEISAKIISSPTQTEIDEVICHE